MAVNFARLPELLGRRRRLNPDSPATHSQLVKSSRCPLYCHSFSNQALLQGRIGVLRGRSMDNNPVKNDAAECLNMAHRCLIEASRTLDREAAETMRNLAKRYFKKADRHEDD